MRSSRISQDTERIMSALSSRNGHKLPQRRSLRQTGQAADLKIEDVEALVTQEQLDNEISMTTGTGSTTSTSPHASRKRKRGVETPATTISNLSTSSDTVRRSPREADSGSAPLPRKARRQPAKHIKGSDGLIEPPAKWEEVYSITAEMRKRVLAPVDTMGCESLAEDDRSPLDRRLQTLVALMLSSQTKDTVTAVAMRNLQADLPGGFCLESLLAVEPGVLNGLIAKVGFHNNKTKFIKATAEILRDRFGGDIPDTIEGMVSLPGVGPKMAYLCMSSAWGRDEGIGVDVHVHRITNLWGWHKTKAPEETRAELESWLPREKWHDINHLLVGFGQTICLPVGRKCGECVLGQKGMCPSAVAPKEVKKRVKREIVVKDEDGEERIKEEVKDEVLVKIENVEQEGPLPDVEMRHEGLADGSIAFDESAR